MSDRVSRLTWGHININVSHLERSMTFYGKLGFELLMPAIPYLGLGASAGAATIPESSTRALGMKPTVRGRACIMQLGNGFPKIDLTELIDEVQRKPLANADLGIVRFCLASRNLKEDHAHLISQGVDFLSPPQPGKDGLADVAVCVDPDGTLIELIQVYLDKWPSRVPPGSIG